MKSQTINDAVDFIRGITFKPHELVEVASEDAVVCMRTKNVQNELSEDDLIAVPKALVRNPEKYLRPGDILLSSANSWELVGKCSYVGELNYPATAGGFISIVRPKAGKTDPRFLYHWISLPSTQHTIRNLGRQTTNISNLDVARFKQLDFPNIDLDEQHRISSILDTIDRIRNARKQLLQMADQMLRSEFLNRFGDPLTNPKNFNRAPIAELGSVVTGNTPPRKQTENFGRDIEWIKSDNINTPNHFLTTADEYLSEIGRSRGRTAPAGSTLVTCIAGSPSVIGNAAMADREVAFNQQINAVIPFKSTDPYFLYCQFLVGKKLIQSHSTNSMKGMVSKGKFQEICFLKPEPREQELFGDFCRKLITMIGSLGEAHADSETLFGSVATRAFNGEL